MARFRLLPILWDTIGTLPTLSPYPGISSILERKFVCRADSRSVMAAEWEVLNSAPRASTHHNFDHANRDDKPRGMVRYRNLLWERRSNGKSYTFSELGPNQGLTLNCGSDVVPARCGAAKGRAILKDRETPSAMVWTASPSKVRRGWTLFTDVEV